MILWELRFEINYQLEKDILKNFNRLFKLLYDTFELKNDVFSSS